jgi:hypothetical protein
LSGV